MPSDTKMQIRWLAQQALSGFDTLDPVDAVDGAKADLADILKILDVANRADVPLMTSVESGVR
jgi:hypothetical protein